MQVVSGVVLFVCKTLLHVLQLVDFKALATTGFYSYSMAIIKTNDPTCILA